MADSMKFARPKAYDPTLAETSLASRPTPQRTGTSSAFRAQEFGFDNDPEIEEKNKELYKQIEILRVQASDLQAAAASAKEGESLATRKLQSFQQVNRSQNTLMRAELQKCRRRLAHTQEVAKRLQQQTEWFQANSPVLTLPVELQGLPKEEKHGDEAGELQQAHHRWEADVAHLAAQIQADLVNGGTISSASTADSEASNQRISELEAKTKQQAREVEQLRRELQHRPQADPSAPAPASAAAPEQSSADVTTLKQEIDAKTAECAEQKKKLKALAQAFRQKEQAVKDLEAKLATASEEAAKPKAPVRPAVSSELVGRVRSELAREKGQMSELRTFVTTGFQQQLPKMLQEAIQQQVPRLQQMISAGSEEWKTKYMVEAERRKKLHNLVQELKGNIRVYCRVRPLNEREAGSCISYPEPDEISIYNSDLGTKKSWQFNEVFSENTTQAHVFAGVRDLVVSMLDGFNVCIFAYGQTGAGKTHSMQGTSSDPGIYQRTFDELFKVAEERKGFDTELSCSLTEIYNEEIRDLLLDDESKRTKLVVKMMKEGNVTTNYVPGLTKEVVTCTQDVENLLEKGQRNRSTACTDMNHRSSRSHLLVQIYGSMKTSAGKQINSIITLVDLAGSERLAKSGVTGDRAKEAICINKSLSALGDVINSRATKSAHTPFRNSTLTHLLQDSLSGDSKTLMLLQINPCQDYVEESMCSLTFGGRVNSVEMQKK